MHRKILTLQETEIQLKPSAKIIKALPDNISKRISNISSEKAIFNNAASFYNDVLSVKGYKENLTYQQDLTPLHFAKCYQVMLNSKCS